MRKILAVLWLLAFAAPALAQVPLPRDESRLDVSPLVDRVPAPEEFSRRTLSYNECLDLARVQDKTLVTFRGIQPDRLPDRLAGLNVIVAEVSSDDERFHEYPLKVVILSKWVEGRHEWIANVDRVEDVAGVLKPPAKQLSTTVSYRAPTSHTHTCPNRNCGDVWDHSKNPGHTCQQCGAQSWIQDTQYKMIPIRTTAPAQPVVKPMSVALPQSIDNCST